MAYVVNPQAQPPGGSPGQVRASGAEIVVHTYESLTFDLELM